MTKSYKTRKTALNIVVSTPKGNRHVEFVGGYINAYGLRGAYFTTDNEDMQKGIEEHEYFANGDIYLDKQPESKTEPPVVKVATPEVKHKSGKSVTA